MRDLDKAKGPIQRAEWARENLREATRDLRAKLEAVAKIIDDVEREENRAEATPPTVSDMRAIFGEPVEGRDYDVMPGGEQ